MSGAGLSDVISERVWSIKHGNASEEKLAAEQQVTWTTVTWKNSKGNT